MALMGKVDPRGFGEAQEIDSTVLEEAAVFDRRNRLYNNLGNIVVLHQLTLGTLLGIEQRSQHLGLEFIGLQLSGGAAVDGRNRSVPDADGGRFGTVIRLRSGQNFNRAAMQTIAAQRRFALFFGIARMTQLRRNLRDS